MNSRLGEGSCHLMSWVFILQEVESYWTILNLGSLGWLCGEQIDQLLGENLQWCLTQPRNLPCFVVKVAGKNALKHASSPVFCPHVISVPLSVWKPDWDMFFGLFLVYHYLLFFSSFLSSPNLHETVTADRPNSLYLKRTKRVKENLGKNKWIRIEIIQSVLTCSRPRLWASYHHGHQGKTGAAAFLSTSSQPQTPHASGCLPGTPSSLWVNDSRLGLTWNEQKRRNAQPRMPEPSTPLEGRTSIPFLSSLTSVLWVPSPPSRKHLVWDCQ